jgi:hypothetical protein
MVLKPEGVDIPHMQQRLNYHLILPLIWDILITEIYRLYQSFVFNFIMTSILKTDFADLTWSGDIVKMEQ